MLQYNSVGLVIRLEVVIELYRPCLCSFAASPTVIVQDIICDDGFI